MASTDLTDRTIATVVFVNQATRPDGAASAAVDEPEEEQSSFVVRRSLQ